MSVTNVGIKLTLDGAQQAEAGLRRVQGGMAALGNTAESVRGALQQLAGAFAGVVSVRAFVQAADAVTQLQNQLRLATGSTQAATAAYQQLFEIAQRSRVSFTELGGTFASIARASESLGLSQQQLLRLTEAIGNAITVGGQSAAASQAALVQLSQGLASGVLRGEELNSILEQTPRLAQALADGLGVSTGALRKMGEEGELTAERVIGALQSQASVLADEVQSSVVTVGQAFTQLQNSATALVGEIDRVSGSSATLAGVVQAASESLDNIARAFRDTQSAGQQVNVFADAIAVVFETVAVLGVNVAYVIKQIGVEIGGLAAQAAAVARLDFSAAREIGRMMREDAEAARREVDALSERILNSRRMAEQARQGGDTREQAEGVRQVGIAAADTKKRIKELGDEFAAQREAARGWADAYQDFARIAAQANAESLGLTKAQARLVEFLSSPAYANASEQMRQLALEQAYAAIAAEQNAAAQEQQAKALQELNRSAESAEEQLQRMLDEERALVIAAERNITLAQAIEEVAIARLREQQAALMAEGGRDAEVLAIQREIDARERLAEAIGRKEAREAAAESAREAEREWQRTAENIERSLTDALMRGFESGKDAARNLRDTVVNMFSTLVLRPVVQAVVVPVAGGITGALGLPGVASAAGTVGNAASGISGVGNLFSGISTLSSALGLGLGAGFTSIAQAGIGGWLSAGTSLIGTGTLGGIGAGLGLLAGPVGGALAIGGLVSSLFGDDDEPRYKFLTNSGNTKPGKLFEDGVFVQSAYGNIGFHDYAKNIDANEFQETFQAIAQLDNAIAATLSPSENDRIRQALDGYVSGKNEATVDYVANRLRIITDTVGGAIDQLADQFDGTSEEFVDYVYRLVQARSLIPALQDLGVALDDSSTAAIQLALTLSDAFGGAQNAAQALAGYFQNYYTEAERVEVATRRLREAFAAIGVEMPATREAFRALVESQDLTTESGRAMYAALMQLQGAFAELTVASGNAADDVRRVAEERVAEERARLEQELLRAQGNTAELRRRELESLDASNRGLQQQIWALEDARAAQEAYNAALSDARSRFAAAESELAAAQSAVDAIRQQATNEYLAAQDRVTAAQERIGQILREQAQEARRAAEAVREMGRSLREFAQGELAQPTQLFADTLRRALAGDEQAMRDLPAAARGATDQARLTATTSGDARLAEARIMAQVLRVANMAESTPLPSAPAAADPLVEAQQELARAQSDLANALRVANTIGASLTPSINNLVTQYNAAVADLARAQAEYAEALRVLRSIEGNTGQTSSNTSAALLEFERARLQIVDQLVNGFTRLDTNLDGLMDFDEFQSAFSGLASDATLRSIFALLDADGDRVISQLEAVRVGIINSLASNFSMLDTSVDELLTFSEFKAGFGGLASEATLQTIFREIDVNSDGFISRLEAIRLNTAATVSGLSSLSTGATQRVTFADNDQIRSVFNNISRTNELLIDGLQLQLMALRGQNISETLQPIGAQDSLYIGTYTLQHQSRNYLRDIVTYTANTAFEARQTNLNLLNVMSGAQRFWVRGSTTLFAKGGVFTNHVVDGATPFDMGVMGEAGPEAIMPLKRMPDGKLGVVADMPDWSRYGRFDNADVVAEVRALRADNQAQARALVQLQQRMTKIIERWDSTGLPEERVLA